jgi:methanethiol S-methyltransferase
MRYFIFIILWITWCSIHSGMITLTFGNYVKNRFSSYHRFYRICFNLIALTTLMPLILYSNAFKGTILFRWQGYWMTIQIFLFAISMGLFVAGGLKYDMLQFFGVRQIISGKSQSTLSKSGEIDTTGILSVTRHPWYLAAIIFIWVDYHEMYVSTLVVNIILTSYLVIGTFLEERKLIIEFGDVYRDYRNRVSMLFPAKWILKNIGQD